MVGVPSDTRARLIRTTGRLLRKQGYAATGLNQVMAEADAPKGSMYFHFPGGKQELAAAAVERFADRVLASMATGLDDAGTVEEAVTAYFDAMIAHMERTDYADGCAVAVVALEAAADHPALVEATTKGLQDWIDLFAEALEAEGRSPDESRSLATLVVAALEGVVVLGRGMRSVDAIAATRDALRTVLAPPTTSRS
jgi:TetR/AcrR family transcriptional repressor of lmrAB and yxaGH operons